MNELREYILLLYNIDYNNFNNNKRVFCSIDEAFLEMCCQILYDLSGLSDFTIEMDFDEQTEFFINLMLGNVEELNGYEIDFDREHWNYTRKDENEKICFEAKII